MNTMKQISVGSDKYNKPYLAIYDFCETLVDFQTGDEFINFIEKKTGNKRIIRHESIRKNRPFSYFFKICDGYFDCCKGNPNKLYILNELKGMSRKEIDFFAKEYYETMIKPHLIKSVINRFEEDKCKGTVIIVSASYMPFLSCFGKEYDVSTIITNEFLYKNGVFTGKLMRNDCWGKEKVTRLYEKINNFNDYYSVSYSDSRSDLPILEIANKAVVVSRGEKQEWASKKGFEQVVWDK